MMKASHGIKFLSGGFCREGVGSLPALWPFRLETAQIDVIRGVEASEFFQGIQLFGRDSRNSQRAFLQSHSYLKIIVPVQCGCFARWVHL